LALELDRSKIDDFLQNIEFNNTDETPQETPPK